MKNFKLKTTKADETKKIGEFLGGELKYFVWQGSQALVISLVGDLGAGKTLLASGILKGLGAKGRVQSPTFVLMKRYVIKSASFKNFWHGDAYRIDDAHELKVLNWDEILKDSKNIILMEWAERVKKIIPKKSITIKIKHKGGDKREIEFIDEKK